MTSVSAVFDFNASLNEVTPASPMMLSVDLMKMEKSGLLTDVAFVLFLLCSPFRLSAVSVVFDFNASLNDSAPLSLTLSPVYLVIMKEWIVDGCHLYCFHCAHNSN